MRGLPVNPADDESGYFPTFEGPDEHGHYFVNWRQQRWVLLTPIMDNWQLDQWPRGFYERIREPKVELSFKMTMIENEPNRQD